MALFISVEIFALVIRVFIAESFAYISKYHPFLTRMLYHPDSDTLVIKKL